MLELTLNFIQYFLQFEGAVKDKDGVEQFNLEGAWDEGLVAHPVNGLFII